MFGLDNKFERVKNNRNEEKESENEIVLIKKKR